MKNLITFILITVSISLSAQCVGDCQNGEGTKTYSNGNKYQGTFKNGKRHGQGKFKWPSGAMYDGLWVDGKREGKGQEILADGTIYVGEFKNDQKEGQGTLYNNKTEKKIIQQGTWVAGKFQDKSVNQNNIVIQPTPTTPATTAKPKSTTQKIINLGLGLGSFYGLNTYTFSGATSSSIPPISISIDFPSKKTTGLTLGGYLGYTSNKLTVTDNFFGSYGWKSSYFIIGARGTYSYNLFNSDKTVPYGSVMLGYNVAKSSYFGDDAFNSSYSAAAGGFTYSGAIGIRHMFNSKTGAFAELGYGIAYLTVGLSLKM
ncbi:MAG: hypothetical protein R2774_09435 [Saprospiraceae bacterium]